MRVSSGVGAAVVLRYCNIGGSFVKVWHTADTSAPANNICGGPPAAAAAARDWSGRPAGGAIGCICTARCGDCGRHRLCSSTSHWARRIGRRRVASVDEGDGGAPRGTIGCRRHDAHCALQLLPQPQTLLIILFFLGITTFIFSMLTILLSPFVTSVLII